MTSREIKLKNVPKFDRNALSYDIDFFVRFSGLVGGFIDTSAKKFLYDESVYRSFVKCFENREDNDLGWRGEYWGKFMRGAVFTYAYTRDDKLYKILENTVREMLSLHKKRGKLTTYKDEIEFCGWDIWSRKYVLLAFEYFVEYCKSENLTDEIIKAACENLDYIMTKIGRKEDGKLPITEASRHWRGLNSASLLEPVVKLYNLTGKPEYLGFAEYIVSTGATSVANLFELAYENNLKPYQYPITKAYEMISCFEGLMEYYRICGGDEYKTAIVNFADRILECDFTVIGCCGCTGEQFDHSAARQSNPDPEHVMQETCVTVTLMKFFYGLNELTGNPKYIDAFERSLYNAYFGAVNFDGFTDKSVLKTYPDAKLKPLPFDSYSPLCGGHRGKAVGGLKNIGKNDYYGCCACIGMLGMGLIKRVALMRAEDGFALNLFVPGVYETVFDENPIEIDVETDYPVTDTVKISFSSKVPQRLRLAIRIPAFSENTELLCDGEKINTVSGEYAVIEKRFFNNKIELRLDMSPKAVKPIIYGSQILMTKVIWGMNYIVPVFDKQDEKAKDRISVSRGPLVLGEDLRLRADAGKNARIIIGEDGRLRSKTVTGKAGFKTLAEEEIETENGSIILCDYFSLGKTYDEKSDTFVWIENK